MLRSSSHEFEYGAISIDNALLIAAIRPHRALVTLSIARYFGIDIGTTDCRPKNRPPPTSFPSLLNQPSVFVRFVFSLASTKTHEEIWLTVVL
ncbi:hypothetical protein DICVIV_09404 [Dictyocaulus viviparus]|uniref:Uncharacterized protein n=1 Tax=Dictyocaulus viviparus TaxID=29172 RepID=A0A0D8XL86_DICVI|nr:hypothetical protein DICVIV_09404 [Dictyocaulus viviparus]